MRVYWRYNPSKVLDASDIKYPSIVRVECQLNDHVTCRHLAVRLLARLPAVPISRLRHPVGLTDVALTAIRASLQAS